MSGAAMRRTQRELVDRALADQVGVEIAPPNTRRQRRARHRADIAFQRKGWRADIRAAAATARAAQLAEAHRRNARIAQGLSPWPGAS